MPMVTHQRCMSSMAPLRSPMALAVRVSRLISSTRVWRPLNCSGVSSSWASLKARWPLMPMPPKQMSTPPSFSIVRAMLSGSLGSGNTRWPSGMTSSGRILLYTVRSMKPRKLSLSSLPIHCFSSVRYSSMLRNHTFFRLMPSPFTMSTK